MKARYPVQYLAFTGSETNDYGETVEGWAAPVDVLVFGINFPETAEAVEAGHDRVMVDKVMLIPPTMAAVKPRDRFIDKGRMYEVIGEPETAEGNPLAGGWNPGGRLKLQRVAG